MWNRQTVKESGKAAFKANYWRCVLVALILTILTAGAVGTGGAGGASTVTGNESSDDNLNYDYDDYDDIYNFEEDFDIDQFIEDNPDLNLDVEDPEVEGTSAMLGSTAVSAALPAGVGEGLLTGGFAAVLLVFIILAIAIGLVVRCLLINPIVLGCKKFFYSNLDAPAEVGEVGFAFSKKYGNYVKALLLTDVYSILWTFLFIIPGIIKLMYSYRLVPYILMDDPDIGAKAAVTRSRDMMNGHKWNAFVYDLSFIGWMLLSILTLGLLAVFYVSPYKRSSDAELYRAIRDGGNGFAAYEPENGADASTVIETTVETGANDTGDVL